MTRQFLTPKRFAAVLIITALLVFGFYFGDDIDRACIVGGFIFAVSMAGGVPEAIRLKTETREGELDG